MIIFDRIDTRLFKAFLAASETKNFTTAAGKAGMTQSGVSQHIARLEEQVGVPLFERVNKKVLLTAEGSELKSFIETYSDTLDSFVDRVAQRKSRILGAVSYAMPSSCLKTPHFSMLLEERAQFPDVDLKVVISANDEIFEKLVAGDIDFGFVTKRSENPAVMHQIFAQEEYVLVASDKAQATQISAKTLADTPFIFYPGMDVLLEYWRQAHFPQKRNFNAFSMLRRGEINPLDGAITMVLHGVGCGIFPRHCVEPFIATKKLHVLKQPGKSDPKGDIYIVTRRNQAYPNRVRRVLDAFWGMKKAEA